MRDRSELVIERLTPVDLKRAIASCSKFRAMEHAEHPLSDFLKKENNILISAEWDSKPVGQIIAYLLPRLDQRPPQLLLYSIDVIKTFRQKGIGTKLIIFFLETAKQLNCGKCFVLTNQSNLAAMNLYRKTGAEQIYDDDAFLVWTI